ncbi:MAG: ParB N-terminal domain-containing protein [Gammaproteobacteria bacterium]|nr:ParB N-terminal domain-containing protein [Gammaproteobacteria bacterium]
MNIEKFNIYETKNYNLFKLLDSNREPNQRILNKLEKSIKEIGIQIPIIVNTKNQIVDGQHRFWTLQKLGYVVPYIISKAWKKDNHTIEINNTSSNWTSLDYANFQMRKGNLDVKKALQQSYIWQKETNNKFKIINGLELIVSGKSYSGIKIKLKNGLYISDLKTANKIFQILKVMNEYPRKTSAFAAKFVRATKMFFYDHKKINILAIRKMCRENYILSYNNELDTLEYLTDIYNKANKSLKREKTLF